MAVLRLQNYTEFLRVLFCTFSKNFDVDILPGNPWIWDIYTHEIFAVIHCIQNDKYFISVRLNNLSCPFKRSFLATQCNRIHIKFLKIVVFPKHSHSESVVDDKNVLGLSFVFSLVHVW